ncbi:DeoR/GlpR family DNA-binding transcription regulator [Paraburkholderia sp. GAS42]|jgi:DeoR family glycerol-3-phosphate regulon repressor|uniref:DeoR/GlpR family DNA-binding transcription regulator n=1 Tax=Paraburkholderia sp. GAS42 TaxID=3035135 RepID=UPI003D24FAD2
MFPTQRQAEIMRIVRSQQTCTITGLASLFDVSDETVRRTIKPLISDGLLVKVHGGIMLPEHLDEPPFQRRMQENREGKQIIAARIGDLIEDGDSLILDSGTTCVHIAQALSAHSRLTVVTNSAEIARTLAPRNENRVFMTGGELRPDDASAFGENVLTFIRQFHVRYAIVSVTAIDNHGRLMDSLPWDAAFAQAAFAQAEQRVVAADHAKFGHSALVRAFNPDELDLLVTDAALPPEPAEAFSAAGLKVLTGAPPANVESGDAAATIA